MEKLPPMSNQDPQRSGLQKLSSQKSSSQKSSRRQDYAYRIAAAVAALFLLLTWLSA
ncbi:MAG: hypothetical protein WBD46_18160 [Acidobacteriaceae bacterium]